MVCRMLGEGGEGKCDIYVHLLISMLYFVLFFYYQLLPM